MNKILGMRKLSVAVALAAGVSASQAALWFDPDGAGGDPAIQVGSVDWGPTSVAGIGSNAAVALFLSTGQPQPFRSFVHAKVIGFLDTNGDALPNPAGLNSAYEITMIAGFTQVVIGVAFPPATPFPTVYTVTLPQAGEFLQWFYDGNVNSNALSGHGFNDGRLILSASQLLTPSGGTYSDLFFLPNAALDGFGVDNYTTQLTRPGFGNLSTVPVGNIAVDPSFFVGNPLNFALQYSNISESLQYDSVNPSHCFNPVSIGIAVGATNPADTACDNVTVNGLFAANASGGTGLVPNIGPVNGALFGAPDQVFQTDYNSPVNARYVPEPASLSLLGLGLAGMALVGKRRRRPAD